MDKPKKGLVVFNRSYVDVGVVSCVKAFQDAFKDFSIDLVPANSLGVVFENGNAVVSGRDGEFDFAVFFDKDVLVARALEGMGYKVFNSASAIELCDDKSKTLLALSGLEIAFPKTIVNPLLYNAHENSTEFVEYVLSELSLPVVVKKCYGSMGTGVYLAETKFELLRLRRKLITQPHLYQEFISPSLGEDFRYYVVNGEVVGAVRRSNTTDFRSNIASGGQMEIIQPSEQCCSDALSIAKTLNLTYGAVDFLNGGQGKFLLCEVNSNPFFINYWRLSGINLANKLAEAVFQQCYC